MTDQDLKNEQKEITSFKLSNELYKRQQLANPVTLNSLVAACILACNSDTLTIEDILRQTTTMFVYLKLKKNAFTFMQTKPMQPIVEKQIEGLGFKLTEKGKKTASVALKAAKENFRDILALAHYSLRLSSVFVLEQCFAYLIWDHFKVKASTEPITLKELFA